jgi:hypothetical protein
MTYTLHCKTKKRPALTTNHSSSFPDEGSNVGALVHSVHQLLQRLWQVVLNPVSILTKFTVGRRNANWKGFRATLVVNALENGEVGVADLIAKEVGTLRLGVVFTHESIVLRNNFVFVIVRSTAQGSYPCRLMLLLAYVYLKGSIRRWTNPPVIVKISDPVDDVLFVASIAVVTTMLAG